MAGTALRTVMTWLVRRPIVLPALLAGAALIGLSAGPRAADDSWVGLPRSGSVGWIPSAIIIAAAVLGLITMLVVGRRPPAEGGEPRSLFQQLVGMALFAAFLMLLFLLPRIPNTDAETADDTPPPSIEAPADRTGPSTDIAVQPADGAVALAVLVLAVMVLLWFRRAVGRARPVDLGAEADEGSGLEPAMARASRHLLDDTDPRNAVLLAYRELEETLESLNLARAEAETPVEHLTRSLRALSITSEHGSDPVPAQPLLDLAALYARARFSEQAITAEDQRQAGVALERAHRRLSGTGS